MHDRQTRGLMKRVAPRALLLILVLAACRRSSPMSTEDIIGEWRKTDSALPPVSLLITAEGVGYRARLRLSGVEAMADAKLSGTDLHLDFDNDRPDMVGHFVSKTELDLPFSGARTYRLRKRP